MSFTKLPDEILIEIFLFLQYSRHFQLLTVNKDFERVLTSGVFWKCMCELYFGGVFDAKKTDYKSYLNLVEKDIKDIKDSIKKCYDNCKEMQYRHYSQPDTRLLKLLEFLAELQPIVKRVEQYKGTNIVNTAAKMMVECIRLVRRHIKRDDIEKVPFRKVDFIDVVGAVNSHDNKMDKRFYLDLLQFVWENHGFSDSSEQHTVEQILRSQGREFKSHPSQASFFANVSHYFGRVKDMTVSAFTCCYTSKNT
jgi:hypothetical protein